MAIFMLLLANVGLLGWLGVDFVLLVEIHLLIATFCLAGLQVISKTGALVEDRGMLFLLSCATGLVLFTLLVFVLFHLFDTFWIRLIGWTFLLSVIAGSHRQRASLVSLWSRSRALPSWAAGALLLALVVSG
jgi:hypothetical protein